MLGDDRIAVACGRSIFVHRESDENRLELAGHTDVGLEKNIYLNTQIMIDKSILLLLFFLLACAISNVFSGSLRCLHHIVLLCVFFFVFC